MVTKCARNHIEIPVTIAIIFSTRFCTHNLYNAFTSCDVKMHRNHIENGAKENSVRAKKKTYKNLFNIIIFMYIMLKVKTSRQDSRAVNKFP